MNQDPRRRCFPGPRWLSLALLAAAVALASCRSLNAPTPDGGANGGGGQGGSATGGTGATAGAGAPTGGSGANGGSGSGGAATTGGAAATGGAGATGGLGTAGMSMSAGGATGACQTGDSRCAGTTGMQTCAGGQWQPATSCLAHQSCVAKRCECIPDGLCSLVGGTCSAMRTVVACAQDAAGCFYQGATTTCAVNQFCTGAAGKAACACRTDSGCLAAGAGCSNGDTVVNCVSDSMGCLSKESFHACDVGETCTRGGAGCANLSWAPWTLPPATGGASYRNNGDGTITDTITGLMWAQQSTPTQMSWDGARGYCNGLGAELGHYTDWRLPTRMELLSLLDYGKAEPGPAINATFFPGTHTDSYWTSSRQAGGSSTLMWLVNFKSGVTNRMGPSEVFWARCVR